MATSKILSNFIEGTVPRNVRILAAQGLVPLPPDDSLFLLVLLARDPDEEVLKKSEATLKALPETEILARLESGQCRPEVLDYFSYSDSGAIQEAVILHPETGGHVIVRLAARVAAPLLETILYNRTRLLESPEILREIKSNPPATPQILGQVQEIETEFFGDKQRSYDAVVTEDASPVAEQILELEGELTPEELALEGLPVEPEAREVALLQRIATMTVRQKMHLALMGSREARAILVRDSNKEITRCVLQSPKLSLNEVEAFAAMRQLSDGVLRTIGNNKTWTKSYPLVHNLVRNPKTPPMIAQRMLLRLLAKDLIMVSRDRGVPDAVRKGAERLVKQRAGRN